MSSLKRTLLTDHKLVQYLLVLTPSQEVSVKINNIKHEINDAYGCKQSLFARPYLTLINFVQDETEEFRINNCFSKFVQYVKPFEVVLDGFGQFPSHTIYIKVANPTAITDVVKEMRSKFQSILKNKHLLAPKFTTAIPYLSVAKKLTPIQHQLAWADWAKQDFSSSFVASEILLLRRAIVHQNAGIVGNYQPVQHFSFRGKVRAEQLALGW